MIGIFCCCHAGCHLYCGVWRKNEISKEKKYLKFLKRFLFSGFYNRKGFILCQHPLDSTISAMWQMVAEQEVGVVVVLTNLDNQDYRPFWPDR